MREIDPNVQDSEIEDSIRIGGAIPSYANNVSLYSVYVPATGLFLGLPKRYVPGQKRKNCSLRDIGR